MIVSVYLRIILSASCFWSPNMSVSCKSIWPFLVHMALDNLSIFHIWVKPHTKLISEQHKKMGKKGFKFTILLSYIIGVENTELFDGSIDFLHDRTMARTKWVTKNTPQSLYWSKWAKYLYILRVKIVILYKKKNEVLFKINFKFQDINVSLCLFNWMKYWNDVNKTLGSKRASFSRVSQWIDFQCFLLNVQSGFHAWLNEVYLLEWEWFSACGLNWIFYGVWGGHVMMGDNRVIHWVIIESHSR